MANYANLLATIAANIYTNGNQEVTAAKVKTAMNEVVNTLGAGYQFMGVAHPADTPSGYADLRAFWLAGEEGTYTDFGGLVLADGEVAILKYNGSWSKEVTGAASLENVSLLSQELMDIPFPRESTYITADGLPGATASGFNCTNLIKVNPGETWVYSGFFNAATLYMVWGYPAKSYNNGQGILAGGIRYNKTEFIVPEGINYLMAWGPISTVKLHKKGNLQDMKTDLENLGDELDGLRFDTIGIANNYDASALTSIKYYSLTDGTLQGEFANYRTEEFAIPSWAVKIIASFPASNASFGILLYDADGVFLQSFRSAANLEIDLSGLNAEKAIVQNYSGWTATTFAFLSKNHIADLEEDVAVIKGDISAEYTTIVATRNAADYNSIREIIAGITDASPTKRYIVFVPKGRWFECDLSGKKYVSIVGEDREETIIYCDGASTKLTPSDYVYAAYSGRALNSIAQAYKHVFFVTKDTDVRNITIETNDTKYCVHMDATGWETAKFDNCHFVTNAGVNYPIGIGIRGGQEIKVTNCIIERTVAGMLGVFAHNWNNQTAPSLITFENCHFKGCGFATIDELGSEQEDAWNIINCYSDRGGAVNWMVDVNSQGKTYWVNPATGENETDPTLVPYCIKLNCMGSNVGRVFSTMFSNTNTIARPNFAKYMATAHFVMAIGDTYALGKAVKGVNTGVAILEGTNLPLLGVVESVVDGHAYIAKDNVVIPLTYLYGGTFAVSSLVYLRSDGYLTTTGTGSAIGVIVSDYLGVGRIIHLF